MLTCEICGVEVERTNGRQKTCLSIECKRANNRERTRKYSANNPLKTKDRELQRDYGINIAEYYWMLYLQDGKCAICKDTCKTGRQLAVDHDHETGKVRKLLCGKCNKGLGHYDDDPIRLLEAANYLIGERAM